MQMTSTNANALREQGIGRTAGKRISTTHFTDLSVTVKSPISEKPSVDRYYLDTSDSAQRLRLRDVLLVGSITLQEARRNLEIDDMDARIKDLIVAGYLIVKTIEPRLPGTCQRRNVRYSLLSPFKLVTA